MQEENDVVLVEERHLVREEPVDRIRIKLEMMDENVEPSRQVPSQPSNSTTDPAAQQPRPLTVHSPTSTVTSLTRSQIQEAIVNNIDALHAGMEEWRFAKMLARQVSGMR